LTSDGGSVLKLINYDEKLIAVRERGLTVMRAYGEPQNYKLDESANYYTADGVIENTVATCFNKLFFCTASGIFAFDGNDVERQEYDDSGDIYGYVSAVGYGDRYYVLCSSKRLGKQLVYVYEPINKCGYFMNFSPECLVVCDGLYAFSDGRLYLLEEGTGDGQWKRCGVDFGLASKKVLASIDMQSYGDVKITVSGGGISKTFSGSGAKQVRLSGNSFDFEVSGCGDVYALTATAEAINEV
jgi:hypothetical protein